MAPALRCGGGAPPGTPACKYPDSDWIHQSNLGLPSPSLWVGARVAQVAASGRDGGGVRSSETNGVQQEGILPLIQVLASVYRCTYFPDTACIYQFFNDQQSIAAF